LTTAARVDPTHLRIILDNLLGNAVDHADEGGAVDVDAIVDGKVSLRITNDHAAADSVDTDRVFEPYWRADAARGDAGDHFGLGLALVRRLVAVNGGTARAEHAEGRFTVKVTLPADEESA
jgi:signal transduction histidine kinase